MRFIAIISVISSIMILLSSCMNRTPVVPELSGKPIMAINHRMLVRVPLTHPHTAMTQEIAQ